MISCADNQPFPTVRHACECKTPIDVWWELLTKPRAKLASVDDDLSSEEECDEEEEDDTEDEDPRGHSRPKGKGGDKGGKRKKSTKKR